MKKALMHASVASMIGNFNIDNIKILQSLGYQVDVACNFLDETESVKKQAELIKEQLKQLGCTFYQTSCPRKIYKFKDIFKTYKELKSLSNMDYEIVHTQSPVGGVLCRLAFKEKRNSGATKIIYTAHGFHFFKGSPVSSWILFYPIEKFLSNYTDLLITINREDYSLAKSKFHATDTAYIPGVGIKTYILDEQLKVDRNKKRSDLGVFPDQLLLFSVGELAGRKNHATVIKAIGRLNNPNLKYLIAGDGPEYDKYQSLIDSLGLSGKVVLLGQRNDIGEILKASDVFIHTSVREGLGIAPLEAMYSGLPLISSYINGIKDYTENMVTGVCIADPLSVDETEKAISKLINDSNLRQKCANNNKEIAKQFAIDKTNEVMVGLYKRM